MRARRLHLRCEVKSFRRLRAAPPARCARMRCRVRGRSASAESIAPASATGRYEFLSCARAESPRRRARCCRFLRRWPSLRAAAPARCAAGRRAETSGRRSRRCASSVRRSPLTVGRGVCIGQRPTANGQRFRSMKKHCDRFPRTFAPMLLQRRFHSGQESSTPSTS